MLSTRGGVKKNHGAHRGLTLEGEELGARRRKGGVTSEKKSGWPRKINGGIPNENSMTGKSVILESQPGPNEVYETFQKILKEGEKLKPETYSILGDACKKKKQWGELSLRPVRV